MRETQMDREALDAHLRLLRDEPVGLVEDADKAETRRAKIVPLLGRSIEREAKAREARRSFARSLAALSLAAAVAGVFFGVGRLTRPEDPVAAAVPTNVTSAGVVDPPVSSGRWVELPPGSSVRTDGAPIGVVTPSGARIELEVATRLGLEEGPDGERITLSQGAASFDVPPQGRSRVFTVVAPRATVVVRGTRFRIVVGPDGTTDVELTEGVVGVTTGGAELTLRAPATWSSRASEPAFDRGAPSSSGAPRAPRSDLAEQNRLYEAAMAAKRRGDDAAAVSKLDSLLSRWPDSPLAEEARRERARAAARIEREP